MMVVQNRKVERNWGSHILPSGWNKLESFEHHSHPPHSYFINIFIEDIIIIIIFLVVIIILIIIIIVILVIIIIFLVVIIIIFLVIMFRVKQVGRNTVAWVRKSDSRILSIEEDTIVQVIMQKKKILGGWDIFTFVPSKLWNRYRKLSIEEDTMPK